MLCREQLRAVMPAVSEREVVRRCYAHTVMPPIEFLPDCEFFALLDGHSIQFPIHRRSFPSTSAHTAT